MSEDSFARMRNRRIPGIALDAQASNAGWRKLMFQGSFTRFPDAASIFRLTPWQFRLASVGPFEARCDLVLMFFTVRPLLQHLPGNSSFVRCVGLSYRFEPQINRFGDAEAEVLERERHLVHSLHRGTVIAVAAISVTAARCKASEHIAASLPRTALDAMLWSTDMAEHLGDLIGQRVEIGAQLVTSHAAADGPLYLQDPFSRNAALLPFRHRVGTDAEASSELGLRDNSKNRQEGVVVHLNDYVHRRLSDVNHLLIARFQPVADHKPMVDLPDPALFGSLTQWLEAVCRTRNLSKADIAKIADTSRQAVTRWFKGKGVSENALQLLANWAGMEYGVLLLLQKGKLPGKKRGATEIAIRSPDAHRISRKLDLLASSPETLADIEAMVDHQLEKRAKQRKRV